MMTTLGIDDSLIKKAIDFATLKHEGQTRKFSGLPYVTHPINVSAIINKYCKKDANYSNLMVASLLHDTLEDCDVSYKELVIEFGPTIANLVQELTNDEAEMQLVGKTEYMKTKFVGLSDSALTLKLADRLDNAQDNMPDKTKIATRDILYYLLDNRTLNFTQKQLCDAIFDEIGK